MTPSDQIPSATHTRSKSRALRRLTVSRASVPVSWLGGSGAAAGGGRKLLSACLAAVSLLGFAACEDGKETTEDGPRIAVGETHSGTADAGRSTDATADHSRDAAASTHDDDAAQVTDAAGESPSDTPASTQDAAQWMDSGQDTGSLDGKASFFVYDTDTGAPGLTVHATTNDCTGTVLATGTTDGEGRVEFTGLAGQVLVAAKVDSQTIGGSTYLESWTYNLKVGQPNWAHVSVAAVATETIRVLEEGARDYPTKAPNLDAGAVLGAVFTGSDPRDRMTRGCAKVAIVGDESNATIRYAAEIGIPANLDVATSTSRIFGRFYIRDVAPGPHALKAYDENGSVIGESFVCVRSRTENEIGVLSMTAIYVGEEHAPNCVAF